MSKLASYEISRALPVNHHLDLPDGEHVEVALC